MPRSISPGRLVAGFALILCGAATVIPGEADQGGNVRPSVVEARQRAKLLHGTIHDTLQLVHAQYFREGEKLMIPAAVMNLAFQEMEKRDGIEVRWLVVEGRAMNIDHNPQDEFEKQAVKALAGGKDIYEVAADGKYRFAGPITLGAECLKCHLPSRSSNKSRTAGLLISIPIEKP